MALPITNRCGTAHHVPSVTLECCQHENRCGIAHHRTLALLSGSFQAIKSFILDLSMDNSEAYCVIDKARRSLLAQGSTSDDSPMHMYLGELETFLNGHLPILQPAAAVPGADSKAVIDKLVQAITTIRRSVPSANAGSSGAGGAAAGGNASGGTMAVNNDAVEAVLVSKIHQLLIGKVAKCDLSTEAGRRDAFTAGFDPQHVYSVRALTYGEATVIRRDSTLALLGELRPHLPEYTNYCLRVDIATGNIPDNLSQWSILGRDGTKDTFFNLFWQHKYHVMDWYGSTQEPGMFSFLAARDLKGYKPLAAADHYCVPSFVRRLADFGQNLFCVQGWPDLPGPAAPGQGFTWRTWWLFYADHLDQAKELGSQKAQLDWLDRAHDQAIVALKLMGGLVKGLLTASVDIVSKQMEYLLPWDAAPAQALRDQQAAFLRSKTDQQAYQRFQVGMNTVIDQEAIKLETLPLRSVRHKGRLPKRGLDDDEKPRGGNDEGFYAAPGSLASTCGWVTQGKEFFASGLVWDVPKLAAKYKVTVQGKCWAFLLNRKQGSKKMACCGQHTKSGHETPKSAAHVLAGFEITPELIQEFARAPTDEERAKFQPANNKSKGGGKGGDRGDGKGGGKGDGKGKGRGIGNGRGRGQLFRMPTQP